MSMEVPTWLLDEREIVLAKARQLPPLDAIFLIFHFNSKNGWRGIEIDYQESNHSLSESDLAIAKEKAKKLLHQNAYVGAAFFEYHDCHETFEEAVSRLKLQNPGFSEDSYKISIQDSIVAMR